MGVATRYRVPGMFTAYQDKGPGVRAEAFGRVDQQVTGRSQSRLVSREWNSSPPIVVVAIAIVAVVTVAVTTPIVVTAIAAVVSKAVDVADVT